MNTDQSTKFDEFSRQLAKAIYCGGMIGLLAACGSGLPDETSTAGAPENKVPIETPVPQPPQPLDGVSVGGEVFGYAGGELILKNGASSEIKIRKNGLYVLPTLVKRGEAYEVTIAKQPAGQTCQLMNGKGAATKDIVDIQVTCETSAFYKSTPDFKLPQTGLTEGIQLSFYDVASCDTFLPQLKEANGGNTLYVQGFNMSYKTDSCASGAISNNLKMSWKFWFTAKNTKGVNFQAKDASGNEDPNYRPESEAAVRKQVQDQFSLLMADANLKSSIGAWYITPELLRPWRKPDGTGGYSTIESGSEMVFLQVVQSEIRSAEKAYNLAPKPIVGSQPSYRNQADLEVISAFGKVDYLNMTADVRTATDPLRAKTIYDTVKINSQASANATKYLPVTTLQIAADPPAGITDAELKKTILQNVFAAVVAGTKSVWVDFDNSKTTSTARAKVSGMYLDAFKILNVSESDLGRAFAKGEVGRNDALTPSVIAGDAADLYVQNFYYAGKKYMVAVNRSSVNTVIGSVSGWPQDSAVFELNPNAETNFRSLSTPSSIAFNIESNGVRVWRISIE